MQVKLVGNTRPVIDGVDTAEELVVYTARVSNPDNQSNMLTSAGLLRYLIKNNHWSPFEMVHLVMEINTTRDIARQILRHRSFSFQEFSQRYADATQLGCTLKEMRLQDTKNRQNSIEVDDIELTELWKEVQETVHLVTTEAYKWAIDNKIAKEQARAVLPEGITNSRLYMSGTLRSWLHYCWLRVGNGTQKEHKLVAEQALDIITKEFPAIAEIVNAQRIQ